MSEDVPNGPAGGDVPSPPTETAQSGSSAARSLEGNVAARSLEASSAPPVSARVHALFWAAIGLAIVGVVQVPLVLVAHRGAAAQATSAGHPSVTSVTSAAAPAVASASSALASAPPEPEPITAPRVVQLESDTVEVLHTKVGKRTCVQALEALGVVPGDLARVATALSPLRRLDGCSPNDRVFVALGRADRRLHGLELETAPGTLVQVLEKQVAGEAGSTLDLVAEAVTLPVTHKRFTTSFVVATDVAAAVATAGLDGSLVELLDEAIGSRHDVPAPTRGSTFRLIADATLVAGVFDRWDEVVAFEYRPRADLAPIRLYHTRGKPGALGWFDPKGHQPVRTRWRMPLAFPRITSRFNPRRLHPVLKVVMPHNGCDFAAPPGTPVYAIGPGTVQFRGDSGPSGNLVTIAHEGGIESGYAHLSRFAPGVVAGTHVEARTVVGYVGTTGRSTGPHLHLSVKRNGVFVDPLSLKMDAFRVVPPSERGGFAARKAEADALLDAIAWPPDLPPPAVAPAAASASAEPAGEEEDEPMH